MHSERSKFPQTNTGGLRLKGMMALMTLVDRESAVHAGVVKNASCIDHWKISISINHKTECHHLL